MYDILVYSTCKRIPFILNCLIFSKDIFVSQVDHNSAASKAGLREGDVLVKVNNTALNSRISHEKAAAVSVFLTFLRK